MWSTQNLKDGMTKIEKREILNKRVRHKFGRVYKNLQSPYEYSTERALNIRGDPPII